MNKKNMEEIIEFEDSDNDDKTKMGELGSNLDGYFWSKGCWNVQNGKTTFEGGGGVVN